MAGKNDFSVAYFSMEIAVENKFKNYAGGLGVLAGDILRSAANLNFPMFGITLFNRRGYFKQQINRFGEQIESRDPFNLTGLKEMKPMVIVNIGSENIKVKCWRYLVRGNNGFLLPIYFFGH